MVFLVERYSGQLLSNAVDMDECAKARMESSVLNIAIATPPVAAKSNT
jgi:hypothetical protein